VGTDGRNAGAGALPQQLIYLSATIFLVISSVSLLHTNQYEFIYARFPGLRLRHLSLFDTVLYASYCTGAVAIGLLADRLGVRRIFLVAGGSGAAVSFYLMTIAPRYWILLLFRFFQGFATLAEWQILTTLVLDNSTADNRGRSFGLFGTCMALAMGAGPVFGGFLAARSVFLPYYIGAGLNVLVCAAGATVITEPPEVGRNPNFAQSVAFIRKRPSILVPSLFNFVDRLHIGFIIFILPLYMRMVLGRGPAARGMLLGVHALAFILLQYPVGQLSDRYGRLAFLVPGSLGYGLLLMMAGYAGRGGVVPLTAVFFLLGVFSGLTGPTNAALLGDLSGPEEHARAVAFFTLSGNVGIVFGPLLAGWIADLGSFAVSFVVAGGVELLCLGVCILLAKRYFPPVPLPSFQQPRADD
jgi:MFS family permease